MARKEVSFRRNKTFEGDNPKAACTGLGFRHSGVGTRSSTLTRSPEKRTWTTSLGLAVGAIQEFIHAENLLVDKAFRREGRLGRLEVGPANEKINVLGVAHGGFVHGRNPGSDGVAVHDGVGDAGPAEGRRRSQQALTYSLHGANHPFPGDVVGGCYTPGRHDVPSPAVHGHLLAKGAHG